jgi:NAD(P)-dependent dehydrogenase (short-subunit alcohol dehydrogenase family)
MTPDGKRVVVLGGSSDIGLATGQAAARQEALVIVSNRKARVEQADHAPGRWRALDLTDAKSTQELFARLGSFDHLVFTAGHTLPLGRLGRPGGGCEEDLDGRAPQHARLVTSPVTA